MVTLYTSAFEIGLLVWIAGVIFALTASVVYCARQRWSRAMWAFIVAATLLTAFVLFVWSMGSFI